MKGCELWSSWKLDVLYTSTTLTSTLLLALDIKPCATESAKMKMIHRDTGLPALFTHIGIPKSILYIVSAHNFSSLVKVKLNNSDVCIIYTTISPNIKTSYWFVADRCTNKLPWLPQKFVYSTSCTLAGSHLLKDDLNSSNADFITEYKKRELNTFFFSYLHQFNESVPLFRVAPSHSENTSFIRSYT